MNIERYQNPIRHALNQQLGRCPLTMPTLTLSLPYSLISNRSLSLSHNLNVVVFVVFVVVVAVARQLVFCARVRVHFGHCFSVALNSHRNLVTNNLISFESSVNLLQDVNLKSI